jgi:hypothetical protein
MPDNHIKFKLIPNIKDSIIFFIWIVGIFIPDLNFGNYVFFFLGIFLLYCLGKKLINFQPGLLFLIFISTYLIYLIPLIFFNTPIASHSQFDNIIYYNKTLNIFIFFLFSLNYFLLESKNKEQKIILNTTITRHPSNVVFYSLLIFQLFIIIYASIKGQFILNSSDSYDAYRSNLENQNGLWEYFLIFYILSFVFSARTRVSKILMLIIYLLYAYISITRGYRIQLIQMTFLYFILYYDGKFSNMVIILFSSFGLLFMELYGLVKVIGSLNTDIVNVAIDSNQMAFVTNQTEVFYSTTSVLTLQSQGHLGYAVQLETFLSFIINFIVPTGLLWNGSRVIDHVWQFAEIGGGGFCFGYFYFWFGYVGVFLLSLYLGKLFNSRFKKSNLFVLFLIFTISLTPRWFAYEPTNHLIRLPLTLILLYILILNIFKKSNSF